MIRFSDLLAFAAIGPPAGRSWLHPAIGPRRLRAIGQEPQEPSEPPLPLTGVPLLPGTVPGPSASGRVHRRPPFGLCLWVGDGSCETLPWGWNADGCRSYTSRRESSGIGPGPRYGSSPVRPRRRRRIAAGPPDSPAPGTGGRISDGPDGHRGEKTLADRRRPVDDRSPRAFLSLWENTWT